MEINDDVIVTPKNFDFNHEFSGTIAEIKNETVVVEDGDNNFYEVDFDQVRKED